MSADSNHPQGENAPPKIKLDGGPSGAGPIPIRPSDKKAETTRLDLSQAKPPSASKSETQSLKGGAFPPLNQTMRVEVSSTPPKPDTTRITIPDDAFVKKPGTAPQHAPPPASEDIFKRSTIPVGIPTPPPTPAIKPKTLTVKKPGSEEPPQVVQPDQRSVAEAKKGETARLDLPAEAADRPPTQPKTIKIRRPAAAAIRKPVTIVRPPGQESPTMPPVAATGEEEPVGTVFSAMALVALLVSCVLIYVLAAQTIAPNLPFPGRV